MATRAHQEVGCAAVLPRQPPFCVRPSQSYLSPAEEGEDLTVLGSSPNKSNLTEAKNGGQGAQDILEGSLDKGGQFILSSATCVSRSAVSKADLQALPGPS